MQAVQQGMEEGLMSLREDMQMSQQQITQQFAQYQVHALHPHVIIKFARSNDSITLQGRNRNSTERPYPSCDSLVSHYMSRCDGETGRSHVELHGRRPGM